MLTGEELNITDMSMMEYAHPESWLNSVGGGGGSNGISQRSTVARAAAAQAMKMLMNAASTKLGVPVSGLTASNGVITGGSESVKYSELYGGKLFAFDLAKLTPAVTPAAGYIPGQGITKPVADYKLVGSRGTGSTSRTRCRASTPTSRTSASRDGARAEGAAPWRRCEHVAEPLSR